MHQVVLLPYWDDEPTTVAESALGRATRARHSCRGAQRCCPASPRAAPPGLGLSVLTSDPVIESVYRAGLLSLKDLRALTACTSSEAIQKVAQERARLHLTAAAEQLRGMRGAFELCAARVRGLALDAEARLLQLGVPMNAVHPELSSPLRDGAASAHPAVYGGLLTLSTVLRAASHPAAWAERPASIWEALAASTGLSMRPQLVLLLSSLLPVEARLSYLALRPEAYSHGDPKGVRDLGGLLKSVLLRMMCRPYGPHDMRRLTKQLKQAAPRLSPFNFWLLRQCAAGSACAPLPLAQRSQHRAADEEWLSGRIDALFEAHQEQVLYSSEAWVGWLHALPTRHLVAFYIKFLFDSFQ